MQVTTVGGRKARYRRGGFANQEDAVAARQAILDGPADEAAAGAWTVARWLRYWLAQAEPHLGVNFDSESKGDQAAHLLSELQQAIVDLRLSGQVKLDLQVS